MGKQKRAAKAKQQRLRRRPHLDDAARLRLRRRARGRLLRRARATPTARCIGDTVALRPDTKRRPRAAAASSCASSSARTPQSSAASSGTAPSASSSRPTGASARRLRRRSARSARRRPATSWSRASRRSPRGSNPAQGVVEEVVGHEGDPGIEIEIIIREHGLRPSSPKTALAEAADDRARRRGGARARDPTAPRHPRPLHVHHRPGRRARLRRRDHHRARGRARSSRRAHRRREPLRAVGLGDRQRGAAARDERLPRRPRPADAARGALQRHLLAQPGRGPALVHGRHGRSTDDAVVEATSSTPRSMRSDRRFNYDQVERWLDGDEPLPGRARASALCATSRASPTQIGERRVARGGLDFETVEAKVRLDETASRSRSCCASARWRRT